MELNFRTICDWSKSIELIVENKQKYLLNGNNGKPNIQSSGADTEWSKHGWQEHNILSLCLCRIFLLVSVFKYFMIQQDVVPVPGGVTIGAPTGIKSVNIVIVNTYLSEICEN